MHKSITNDLEDTISRHKGYKGEERECSVTLLAVPCFKGFRFFTCSLHQNGNFSDESNSLKSSDKDPSIPALIFRAVLHSLFF